MQQACSTKRLAVWHSVTRGTALLLSGWACPVKLGTANAADEPAQAEEEADSQLLQ